MTAHVATLEVELRVPLANSLKAKRAALRPLVEGLRARFPVAVAETGHQDSWQRAEVAVAAVSSSPKVVKDVLDACERFVWSRPDLEVVSTDRCWLEHA